jgi:hypothetical protein
MEGLKIKVFVKDKLMFIYKVNHSLPPTKWIEDALKSADSLEFKFTSNLKHPNDMSWLGDNSLRLDAQMHRYFSFRSVQFKMLSSGVFLEDWGNFRTGILVQKIDHSEHGSDFKNQITCLPLLTDYTEDEVALKFSNYAKIVDATHVSISGVNYEGYFRDDCFLFLLRAKNKQ